MSIEASEEHVSHFVSCQNLKSQFSHSNIRNNSPIFLHILSCTRHPCFVYHMIKVSPIKEVCSCIHIINQFQSVQHLLCSRRLTLLPVFGVPFLAGIAGGLLGGALAFGPRPFYPPYPPPSRRQHLILVTVIMSATLLLLG